MLGGLALLELVVALLVLVGLHGEADRGYRGQRRGQGEVVVVFDSHEP